MALSITRIFLSAWLATGWEAPSGHAFFLYDLIFFFQADGSIDYKDLFECLAGYGLGGSSIAMFGRVGGGIFTKAAG
jgi:inorganic pyrophosphatase